MKTLYLILFINIFSWTANAKDFVIERLDPHGGYKLNLENMDLKKRLQSEKQSNPQHNPL